MRAYERLLEYVKIDTQSSEETDTVPSTAGQLALAERLKAEMEKLGFDLLPGEHPIVPVMLYDPKIAGEFARRMLEKGVYVVGFCYPVVPKGRDRVRTQISAGHTKEDLDFAVKCFGEVKKEMGL